MSADLQAWLHPDAPQWPMPSAQLIARARAEGAFDTFWRALVLAQYEGAEAALQGLALPGWLANIVRSTYPKPVHP